MRTVLNNYVPPILHVCYVEIEHPIAASSATVSPSNDMANQPTVTEWEIRAEHYESFDL